MPAAPTSASVTSAFVVRPSPEEFIPVLASRPASTTVTKSGPASCLASSTTAVCDECGSQSQFWPVSVGPGTPGAGTTANALHSATPRCWCAAHRPELGLAPAFVADSGG